MSDICNNKVYRTGDETAPLNPTELAYEAKLLGDWVGVTPADYPARISGESHCECNGYGEFVLLPIDDPGVQEGGKRYMRCRKCGQVSHL